MTEAKRFTIVFGYAVLALLLFYWLVFLSSRGDPLAVGGFGDLPQWVRGWMRFMITAFACSLLFAYWHVEARWVMAAVIASHVAIYSAVALIGPKIVSVGAVSVSHVLFWAPVFVYLCGCVRRGLFSGPFHLWLYGVTAIFAVSLVFDFRDAARYVIAVL